MGTHLIDSGRPALLAQIGGRETGRYRRLQWIYRHHTVLYLGAIAVAGQPHRLPVLAALAWSDGALWARSVALLLALLPASQLAIQAVNYCRDPPPAATGPGQDVVRGRRHP